jgi:co-chaperonin GroES (HSP10)
MRHIQPFHDNIIVQRHEKLKITPGGIYFEGPTTEDHYYEVLAAGPEVKDLKKGDVVYIHPDARRRPADLDGSQIWRVNEGDVLFKEA